MIIALAEDRRRQLPAGVAVDAGRIDEKVAGHILRDPFCKIRHSLPPIL
jgi:hypothetical protein